MNSRRIVNLGLIVILSTAVLSCRNYYKHSYNDQKKQASIENSDQEQWVKEEHENHLVIHVGQEMLKISNLRYDQTSELVVANLNDFQGEPLQGYLKVLEKRKHRATRTWGVKVEDVQQVHLFLNGYEKINDSEIAFYVSDVFQVDATTQADGLNIITNIGLLALLDSARWYMIFAFEIW